MFVAVLFILLMSSCGPVNMFTRLKRTPREYSLNYCYSDTRANKTELNKESWIVFSDCEDNDTWQNPGGKVKMKKMAFMEAFYVTRKKGDYLQLIKYDPEITANNPRARIIKNRKKAQYYGWVHHSHLLQTKQSSLDMVTGFKNKAVTVIVDTFAVSEPHLLFDSDSILAYKDENMTIPNGKIPLHEILYILKSSADRRNVLVSKKTSLNPLEAPSEAPGWVSTSVIKEIGQRLFVDFESVANDPLSSNPVFRNRNNTDTLEVGEDESRRIDFYSKKNPVFHYSPVRSYRTDSSGIYFHTALPAPVIDGSYNYVLNLNGNKIMYNDFLQLEKDLRKLNVVFVFEGKERVFRDYSQIMNVVQNMQSLFAGEDDAYQYKFGAVIAYQDSVKRARPRIKSFGLTDSFDDALEFLMTEKDSVNNYRSITNNQAWEGLRKAVEMIEEYPNESNILIVIGESGYSEYADSALVKRIAKMNGRILGYQIYNETLSDYDNNFVLQIENMIDTYTKRDAVLRRERLVYTEQYKPIPKYRESTRNVYALHYPHKSMTQGWILFPGKSEVMHMDILSKSIDTLFAEVKHDNDTVIAYLYKAFDEFGSKLYRYDPLWANYNGKDSLWRLNMELYRRTSGSFPAWYMPSDTICVEATDENPDYYMLLSENEIKEITAFLGDITKYEPDYKYKGSRKMTRKKPCNCPDDHLPTEETSLGSLVYDKDGHPQYLNTRGIRIHVYRTFMTRLKSSYKICRTRLCRLKRYSPAKAEFEIVGNPTWEPIVNAYRIKDIKRKKIMKDFELDELLLYYKQKKETLENYLRTNKKNTFVSNGEMYYWIKRDLLP
jgi:hypothetical protein